jgi:hypothetical protein
LGGGGLGGGGLSITDLSSVFWLHNSVA